VWSSAAPRGVPALDLGGADLRLRSGAEARCDSCHAEPLPRLASRVARLATTPSPWPSPKYTRYCHCWSASAWLPPRKPAGPVSDDRSAGGTLSESADPAKSYFQAADPDNLARSTGLRSRPRARMCAWHPDEETCPRLQTHAPSELGFIGLGHLGVRMASRLARAGHQLVVFDADAAQSSNSLGRCAASRFGESRSASRRGFGCEGSLPRCRAALTSGTPTTPTSLCRPMSCVTPTRN